VSHANAALTPRQRLRLARKVVDEGWSVAAAAEYFRVSYPTAAKWSKRFVELGAEGMADRSSRPHSHPNRTPQAVVKRIVHLRIKKRLGPVQIAGRLGMPASTVHAVLVRCRLNRLSHVDVKTGEPARRYEHEAPGALIHVDVKKLGNIPDGGGWRFVGRQQGDRNRASTPGKGKNRHRNPLMRHAFVHTVIDDHSRVAYAEIHDDETAATAIGVLQRAVSWFADHAVTVERVLSDNGPAYRSHAWRHACAELGVKPKFTRPRRPQTNGKICEYWVSAASGLGLTPAKV
jgi:transposase InsO family protein